MEKGPTLFDKGEQVTKISFIVVAVLGIIKGVIGFISGSVSLKAQAVDSLTDLVSLVAVYAGLKLSRRPPSERFSYGYYRVETLVSLLVAVVILVTGGYMLFESQIRIVKPMPVSEPLFVLGAAGFSIPVLLWLARYMKRVGEEINSQAVQSQSEDFMTDVYSSGVVFVGVLGSVVGYPVVEGLAGGLISLLIIRVGLQLSWSGLLVLLDAVENPDALIDVKKLAESVHGVIEAKHVRMRRSGPFCLGEVTIMVPEGLDVDKAHRLSHMVEDAVRKGVPSLESLVVHIEPMERSRQRVALPVVGDAGLDSVVSEHFGSAPFFIFVDIGLEGVERWYTRANPGVGLERKRGVVVTDMLVEEDVTVLLSDELGEGPFHILRDSFISVYPVKGGVTVRDAVELYHSGGLELRVDGGKKEKKEFR